MEKRSLIIVKNADLLRCPTKDRKHPINPGVQFTIGDLHGNALKLIYFLVRQNILQLSPSQYHIIVTLYHKMTVTLTKEDIDQFNQIIDSATVNQGAMIRFIGDELADRGKNDYFTLKIFEKLGKEKIPFSILLSNHGSEFLLVYEKEFTSFETNLGYGQDQSLEKLGLLVAKNLVEKQELMNIVENYYLPNFKLIDYVINSDHEITIYTHAPVGLNTIKSLAGEFRVIYHDHDVKQLARTIEEINQKTILLSKLSSKLDYTDVIPESAHIDHPLIRLMWTRRSNKYYELINNQIDPMQSHYLYQITYVHGHDGGGESSHPEQIINLDNYFGKGNETKGVYAVEYLYTVDSESS